MKQGINKLWPTTVIYKTIENKQFLDALAQEILTNFDMGNPPSDFGNYSIFDLDSDIINIFKTQYVLPYFEGYLNEVFDSSVNDFETVSLKGWIAGHGQGYNMVSHNHSGAQVSAVFYILAENQNAGGQIVFTDPRGNANRGYLTDFVNKEFANQVHLPKTGDALIFPSFLYHHVEPYYSTMRICIPVDLYLYKNA